MNKKKTLTIIIYIIIVIALIVGIIIVKNKKTKSETTIDEKQEIAEMEKTIKEDAHVVSFDTDGGTLIPSQTVLENEKLEAIETPTKEGYIFDKWLLDGEEFNLETEITKDLTLKASWKKDDPTVEKVTIKFDSKGGSSVDAITIEKGTSLTDIPTPTKDGYTFINWYQNDKEFKIENIINSNITLTAKWKKINYGTFNEEILKLSVSTYSELEEKLGQGEWINTNVCKPYNSVIGRIYYTSTYIKYNNGYYAVFNYSTKEGDDYKENIKTQKPSFIEFLRAKDIFNDYTDELINDDNKLKDIGATNFEYYPERNFKRFRYGQYSIDIHKRVDGDNEYSKESLVDIVPMKD